MRCHGWVALTIGLSCLGCNGTARNVEKGQDPTKESAPLFYATLKHDEKTVRHLLETGMDPDQTDLSFEASRDALGRLRSRMTALHVAASAGDLKIVKLLIQHGAHVDSADRNGMTPLMYAVGLGNIPVAEYLLSHGADAAKRNKNGLSAIDIAVRKKIDKRYPGLFGPHRKAS